MFNSATFAVVKSATFALRSNSGLTLANTLAFVKYKLPAVSITLAVYRFNQFVAETLLALNKLAPMIKPPVPEPSTTFPAPILPVYVGNAAIILE